MSKTQTYAPGIHPIKDDKFQKIAGIKMLYKYILVISSLFVFMSVASAQTATILTTNQNIFVGAGFNGVYTNNQLRVSLSGTGVSTVTLSVSGAPAGVTILFSTNVYANTSNPLNITNGWNPIWYSVAVANATAGVYPLTFSCSGAATASATVNLIIGPRWIKPDASGDVTWGNGANWSTGNSPTAGADVMFQDAGNTNTVDTSVSINSLTFLPLQSGTNLNTFLSPGVTLSVIGTNGFAANSDSVTANNKTYTWNFYGPAATLWVSNKLANFTINADNTGGSGAVVNMTNLDNFVSYVNRWGVGDWVMAQQGGVGASFVVVSLAKTNIITANFPGDYALTNFLPKFSISCFQEGDPFNNGSANQMVNLGISNAIYAESLAVSQNRAGGNPNSFRFNPVFTNLAVASMPYVTFRNTNGGRMNLIGVGVDSGTSSPGSNTRGVLNLNGGIVDMLVDTIWLGRNRTGSVTTNGVGAIGLGVLLFNAGVIDVNTLIDGYQAYTNNSLAQGQITVGGIGTTNATLSVNTLLELGHTTGDFNTPFGSGIGGCSGQMTILTNGVVKANLITLGTFSGNNFITINAGGVLDVTNTIASTNKLLSTLTFTGSSSLGGALTLHVNGTNTLVYVTNLVTTGSGNVINIASVSGISSFPVTIPVISYVNGTTASLSGGTAAGGLNINVNNDAVNKVISVTLSTGAPKTLTWKGYVNGNWDTTTFNWLDTATGLHTNFATGDSVIFDDTASTSTINVTEQVVPRQSISFIGVAITNNLLAYTFSGNKIAGSASLVKAGTNTLEIDDVTEVSAQITQGTLVGAGAIGSVSVSSGAVMSYSGTVSSGVTCAGLLLNNGTINNGLIIQSGGIVTNYATINGAFSTSENSLLVNYLGAQIATPGSPTIVSNATFINRGWVGAIQGDFTSPDSSPAATGLTVNKGGVFEDTGEGALTVNGTVTIGSGGTFIVGGDGIGTTTIFPGGDAISGRVLFALGSTNIFKVYDTTTYTRLGSKYQDYGGSASVQTYNGGTIKIVYVGPGQFAAGQSYRFFFDSLTYPGMSAHSAYSGTATNTYPILDPPSPGNGLAWNINGITLNDTIGIVGVSTNTFNLGFSPLFTTLVTTNSTNNVIIGNLSWPGTNTGWRLQQLQTALTNGLSATNWTDVFGSAWTNSAVFTNTITTNAATFYRMVYP